MFNKIKKLFKKNDAKKEKAQDFRSDELEYVLGSHKNLIEQQIRFQEDINKALEPMDELLKSWEEFFNEEDKLQASVEKARACGVPEDKILHSYEEGETFFMT